MPKKIIPVPSDFARPKKGAYVKKDESKKSNEPKRSGIKKKVIMPKHKPGPHREQYPDVKRKEPVQKAGVEGKMPLNKYIAHCGICSRREAIDLIKEGKVKVNDAVVSEPGYKVQANDRVWYEGKPIKTQEKFVYYLLNKPKNYITTTDDPEGRKTVLDLIRPITDQRVYPVGRLDRNTTGLLLLTNDGDLAQKLSHPKHRTRKIYHVVLDKSLTKKDFDAIADGLILEDGMAEVDEVAYINPDDKKEIGIEIHSGRNRIVRRIFEHLKYEVKALDRVVYAGLTKKNLPRGKFRALDDKEVIFLKHFNSSKSAKTHAIKTT